MFTSDIADSSAALHAPMAAYHCLRVEPRFVPSIKVRARAQTARWVEPTISSFRRLSWLDDNWDGRGARAINVEDVYDALSFLDRVMKADTKVPAIVPLNSGGIELSWRVEDLEVEAIFDRRRDERVVLVTAGTHEIEETIEAAEKVFADIVARLAEPPTVAL